MRTLKTFWLLLGLLLVLGFPLSSGAVTFDWSGWSRLEAYYQSDQKYYGDLAFVLNSKLSIKDGLSFNSRWDMVNFQGDWEDLWKNPNLMSQPYHQKGYVFFYEGSKSRGLPFVLPVQFYLDYQSEFFKVRAGRAPYHFGLGANYSASKDPFALWISAPDQISVYMEYSFFYLQPSVFHHFSGNKSEFSGLLQAGLSQKDWEIQALYEYPFGLNPAWIELYGEYKKPLWNVRASGTYVLENPTRFSILLESLYRLNKPRIDFKLKAGCLEGNVRLHPNYNVGLLLGNRHIVDEGVEEEAEARDYQIAKGQLENILYVAPHISFYLWEKKLKLEPLFLLAYHKEKFHYEGDFLGRYRFNDSLFFDLKAGALYQEDWIFALLAQAAVSF